MTLLRAKIRDLRCEPVHFALELVAPNLESFDGRFGLRPPSGQFLSPFLEALNFLVEIRDLAFEIVPS
jgi:hypothetical protein